MVDMPIAQNEEYAELGLAHELRARKREETLAPFKCVQMGDSDDSSSSQPTKDDFRRFWYDSERFLKLFLATEISCDRNTPTDKSKSLVTFDDMVELYNQLSIYIGKADFKPNFWDTQPFLKSLLRSG
jgi:hypothetical protein